MLSIRFSKINRTAVSNCEVVSFIAALLTTTTTTILINHCNLIALCLLPNYAESTGSHPNTKVKQHQASLVPGWETTWEHLVQ